MMPPHSWFVPGRKPGTSTKFTTGILKASQKRIKREDLSDALISKQPAITRGWLAMIPTLCPAKRAKHVMIFCA